MGIDRDQVSTDVGTRVLFENEAVRVWEMVLAPGERSDLHRHLYDHVLIYADESMMRGNVEGADADVLVDVDIGWVMHRIVGKDGTEPHYLENVGTESSRHFIIELLGPSASDEPQPPTSNELGRFEFPETESAGY